MSSGSPPVTHDAAPLAAEPVGATGTRVAPDDPPPAVVRPSSPAGSPVVPDALFEAVPTALALFAPDGPLRRANARARSLFRLDAPDRPACESLTTVLAPIAHVAEPLVAAARVGVHALPAVARLPLPHGHRVVELSVVRTDDGDLLVAATDITARESLLEALERRARELGAIFEITPSSVRVLDAAGTIVRANGMALRDHAGPRPRALNELIQRDDPLDLAARRALRREEHPGERALRGETVRDALLVVRRGDSALRRIIQVNAAPITDAARRVVGAVLVERDVTGEHDLADELAAQVRRTAELNERVSTEAERLDRMVDERSRELLELQEARSRDRRLAAVGQLAAGVMHDVNNALNPIMAAAWLLRHHAGDPDTVRDYADRIAKAAETGAATAARVGRFLRQEPMHASLEAVVDLSVVAEEVLQLALPLVADRRGPGAGRITFERAFAPGITVHGIAGELREAVLNLVQNAVDAMPDGGTLAIVTGRERPGEACLEVRDTGVGMSDDVRDRAFEPFFTTKGARGSGLGLSEVYGIVRRHRGRVEITSTPGRGTSVHLCLPWVADEAPRVVASPPAPAVPSRAVLIVEDHADGREFLRRVLVEGGHTVQAVATFAEARALIDRDGPACCDVLITDLGLPDGSGWDVADLARRRHPSLRIGVVTGWEPTREDAAPGAADFILRKPLRAPELLACVAATGQTTASSTDG